MTASSIPQTIVALVELFEGLTWPELIGARDHKVYVFDGIAGAEPPDNFIQIGGDQSPAAEGEQQWASLGARQRSEDYTVECLVTSFVGGDSSGQGHRAANAQRSARTNAFGVLELIGDALRSDPSLRGVADPPAARVFTAELGNGIKVEQTADGDPEAEHGRICTVFFGIHVTTRI